MKLVPHLTFDGNCREALRFYNELLGGSLTMTTFGESPAGKHVSAEWKDKIVHATLTFSNSELAGADVPPEEFKQVAGIYLLLEPDEPEEAKNLFLALSENGEIKIPLQEMFWSIAYGSLIDKFGTPWEISCTVAPTADS